MAATLFKGREQLAETLIVVNEDFLVVCVFPPVGFRANDVATINIIVPQKARTLLGGSRKLNFKKVLRKYY